MYFWRSKEIVCFRDNVNTDAEPILNLAYGYMHINVKIDTYLSKKKT